MNMSALMCTYMHFKSILSKINELEKKCVIQYSFITFCFICLSNFKRINARKENWRQPRRSSVFLRLVLFLFPLYASFFIMYAAWPAFFWGPYKTPVLMMILNSLETVSNIVKLKLGPKEWDFPVWEERNFQIWNYYVHDRENGK